MFNGPDRPTVILAAVVVAFTLALPALMAAYSAIKYRKKG